MFLTQFHALFWCVPILPIPSGMVAWGKGATARPPLPASDDIFNGAPKKKGRQQDLVHGNHYF